MGKRSNFERKPRDYYQTPIEAVYPLLPYLPETGLFAEPCAGDGRLVEHIESLTSLKAYWVTDIEPQADFVGEADALTADFSMCDMCITNPPWDRKILHPMIEHFASQCPTWLLFDANWMFTKQAKDYLPYCEKIVTIGRVKWIEGSKMSGKDDSCWYLFDKNFTGNTIFYGRTA